MMTTRNSRAAGLAIGALLVFAASSTAAEPSPLAAGETAFAFDLYGKLSGGDGNLFFSPFSISSALSLAYAGARGETAAEMERTLRFGALGAGVHDARAVVRRSLEAAGETKGITLHTADALWADRTVKILDGYRKIARETYDAETGTLDFANDPEKARRTINDWANEKTGGGVPELLKPGTITKATGLVLADAIRFLGRWHRSFDAAATSEMPFTTLAGTKSTMRAMMGKAEFPFYEDDDVQILEMPYAGERLSMIALLPRRVDGLRELENGLSADRVDRWIAALAPREVFVRFPKFSFDSGFDLKEALMALGVKSAFGGAADFSGITGERGLFISEAMHVAAIEVEEEGTEASAATAIVMLKMAARPLSAFVADHPFLFFLRDRETGVILFLGRVADPSSA